MSPSRGKQTKAPPVTTKDKWSKGELIALGSLILAFVAFLVSNWATWHPAPRTVSPSSSAGKDVLSSTGSQSTGSPANSIQIKIDPGTVSLLNSLKGRASNAIKACQEANTANKETYPGLTGAFEGGLQDSIDKLKSEMAQAENAVKANQASAAQSHLKKADELIKKLSDRCG